MATNPALWDALDRIRDDIRERIVFDQFGKVPVPRRENVVIRYVPYGSGPEGADWSENVPAIVITPPKRTGIHLELNCSDDFTFPVLVQLVDNNHELANEDVMKSWMRWSEQISRYFSESNLRGLRSSVSEEDWHVLRVELGDQNWIERKGFSLYRNAVSALVISVQIRMSRDPAGRP
jgi:hypothetical protein